MSTVPRCEDSRHSIPYGKNGSKSTVGGKLKCLLASQSHYRLRNGSWSGGGPFYMVSLERQIIAGPPIEWTLFGNTWSGTIGPPVGVPNLPSTFSAAVGAFPTYTDKRVELAPSYASGWARTRPGNPMANLGQFLIELRDFPSIPGQAFHGVGWKGLGRSIKYRKLYRGLPFRDIPKVARDRVAWYSKLGSEYLNADFGWKPFVKDLQDVYRLMKAIDKEMAQIVRDNGKSVRRSGTLMDDTSTSSTTSTYAQPGVNLLDFPPGWTSGSTSYSKTVVTKTRRWYVASYRYYIPDTNSWQWNARARAALFGALPTPSLLYEVMPWSWMLDWFTNVGDVISNASVNAVDNLVALYSYIMEHKTTTTTVSCNTSWKTKLIPGSADIPGGSANVIGRFVQETKARAGGSPYGMGVTFDGLSARQGATLAALGLSRF